MSHWQKIRHEASNLRERICASLDLNPQKLLPASVFIEQAANCLDLCLSPEHSQSANLRGALAVLEDDIIYFNNELPAWFKSYCIAHEFGHHVLHKRSVHCTADDIENFAVADNVSVAEAIVGYGAGERREREANLFALEFLLPCAVLKTQFLVENLTAPQIAVRCGLPEKLIAEQLARALLVPAVAAKPEAANSPSKESNHSQRRAAETDCCPTLVAAGPGTGKTQTLTSRIAYLISKGVEPKRILALTFSNRAAEEMRERIGRIGETAAQQLGAMTFHAFGLDLLRRFYVEANLEPRSRLLDKIDALLHLENNLNSLQLQHYETLHEPTANLAAILAAISRAKDELCACDEYRALGEAMLAEARENEDEELRLKAEKTLETARVYRFYQKYLDDEKMLDFGDLIFRAVRLLRENPAVKRQICHEYDQILVDEFQDVNRACGLLLREIAGDGKNLWAVGDLRQSIYRWRGASPANINLFEADFPNAETVSLTANYRSRQEIVDLFGAFAKKMKAAGANVFADWTAQRGATQNNAAIKFEIADSADAEAARIADNIKLYRAAGFAFKDCAMICRTHAQLDKFAKILSKKGVPVFHLGEIFEREETRDLLALLDLKFSREGNSLVRVARFDEYQIPLADARKIIARQKEMRQTFEQVAADAGFISDLSEAGKNGAAGLASHLSAIAPNASAWDFLANYLFSTSQYLRISGAADDVFAQSKRLAIYQFLRFAADSEMRFQTEAEPVAWFLRYVRKLAHFSEDKNYAQMPAEAEDLDAVRLLTVHSAKGLEFPIVFLPFLGAGKFPGNRKAQICPNPTGMIAAGADDFHDEEEECLFFVAASRAKDFLHLSRSLRYGETNSNESRFLTALKEVLPAFDMVNDHESEAVEIAAENQPDEPHVFYASKLDRYLNCPRDYFYTNILGLKATSEKNVYFKFHSCVYDTLNSLRALRRIAPQDFNEAGALARLAEFWTAAGIDLHPYAPVYRQKAEEIVRRAVRKFDETAAGNEILNPTYDIRLDGGATVRVRLDAVEIIEATNEKQIVIRKYKTGKAPKKIEPDDREVLAYVAAQNHFAGAAPRLVRIYLSDDQAHEVAISARIVKNRLAKYDAAVENIRRRRFAPEPSDDCANCPHFFLCPSGEQS